MHGLRALASRLLLLILAANCLPAQQGNNSVADLEQGARLFQANCITCHGTEGDAVEGIDFAHGRFKRVASDPDLSQFITQGIPGTAMPPFDLQARQTTLLVAYLRTLRESAVHPAAAGDAGRGQALFQGKGGCLGCHRINSNGSRIGPDLSEVGAIRSPSMLEQSILEPDAVVLPEHLFCKAVTRDGVTITGRRLNEDPNTVQLIDTKERLISLNKFELREYTLLKTSAMPSYRDKLSQEEVTDVVKYLTTLKGSTAR